MYSHKTTEKKYTVAAVLLRWSCNSHLAIGKNVLNYFMARILLVKIKVQT